MGSIRFMFAFGTSMLIQTITVGLVAYFGGGAAAWRTVAVIYAIVGVISNTLSVMSVKELSPEELADEETVYTGGDYFASARLTRQQARDHALSLLKEAAEQEGADASTLSEASESIQVLAAYTLQEAQIENLVTAKGYTDCVAFLGDDGISVVVSTDSGELTAEDVAKITDIAMSETGLNASSVKIMAAN